MSINNIALLRKIKKMGHLNNDSRATWVGPDFPHTDVGEYRALAEWSLCHLRMYQGFYDNLNKDGEYKILDIACGTGYNTNIMSHEFKNSEFIGIDIDQDCIDFSKKWNENENITFLQDNILSYKNSGAFDYIFCLETLEHLLAKDHHKTILLMLTNLKPGGLLFLTTPTADTPDAKREHIGYLNPKRFEEFKEIFKYNIESIKFYDNVELKLEKPKKLVAETIMDTHIKGTQASHYRIVMKNLKGN